MKKKNTMKMFGNGSTILPPFMSRVNNLANTAPQEDGRDKHISENEEEIKVFYCLALKDEEEIRKRWGKK